MLQPGVRIALNYGSGGGAPNGNGLDWGGLAAAGWGYGGSSPACDIELAWDNLAPGDWAADCRAGLVLRCLRENKDQRSYRGAPFVFVGYIPNAGGGGTHHAVFAWHQPELGANGTFHIIGSTVLAQLDAMRVRLIRTSQVAFEGQYNIGAGWVSLGTHTSSHWAIVAADVMAPALYMLPPSTAHGLSADFTSFVQHAGVAIPPALTDADDEFDDGIVPALITSGGKWADPKADNNAQATDGTTTKTVSESGDDLICSRSFPGTAWEDLHVGQLRTFYPGTDIDVEIELQFFSGVSGYLKAGFIAAGLDDGGTMTFANYFGDWALAYAYLFVSGYSGQLVRGFVAGKPGATIGTDTTASGIPSARQVFRLRRVGNLWSCQLNGSIDLGSWASDTMRDAAMSLFVVQQQGDNVSGWTGKVGYIRVNEGDTYLDTGPPTIAFVSPGDGATGVEKDAPLIISFTDDINVVSDSILIYVRGALVYSAALSRFMPGWEGSSYAANSGNGYTFTIVPDVFNRWRDSETVRVQASCLDGVGQAASGEWSFGAAASRLGLSIYRMIIQGIRSRDERG